MSNIVKKRFFRSINASIQSILVILTFIPFYFMLVSSLKNNAGITANYFGLVFPIRWSNYAQAFSRVIYYLYNSVYICGISLIGVIILSCVSSFIFAKYSFPGKNFLFYFYLSFLMIPGVLTLIPQFVLVVNMGLMATRWAAILPYIAFGQIMFTYILRTFIEGISGDLFDSATIDGANPFRIFFSIVAPLAKPIITSLALMNFLGNWNDFIWPLLVLRGETMKTVTVGLYSFTDVQQTQYGLLFAGFIIASVPLIVLFTLNMRYFVEGIMSGAIKA